MNKQLIVLCLSVLLPASGMMQPSIRVSAQASQPTPDASASQTTLNLKGLRERVTVTRDERGIPYIEATNDADLYFAQGYVMASDRLWQMDLMRRTMRGETSEIFGRDALAQDKLHRTYGFKQVAEAEVMHATAEERAVLETYARGVNALIESLGANSLPKEFQILQYAPRPWTPSDSLLVIKFFYEALTDPWQQDLMRAALQSLPAAKRDALLIETSPLDVLVVGSDAGKKRAGTQSPKTLEADYASTLEALRLSRDARERALERLGLSADAWEASNNWVVSGKHTATGKPLLANDPHLPALAPNIWYMMHLSAPGVRVAGVTAPGLPGIVIGHNSQIAWGFTNVGPDISDLYLEKFDPQNPRRYMTPGGWREAEVRREEIKVRKGFTSSETEIEPMEVVLTRHGPIVFEKNGARYALRWTALDSTLGGTGSFHAVNRARNWKEFRAALSGYAAPMQNMIYADTEGHIGYYAAGRVPIRKSGDGSLPYDGATDEGEWTGFIPFDKLPQLYDPPSGIIVTANQRITGSDYPYFLTHSWAPPYRARRILTLLQDKQKLTEADFRAIQGDTYTITGALFARELVKLAKAAGPTSGDEKWGETARLLEAWDGRMNADSRAAVLVSLMRSIFRRRVFQAALGEELAKEYSWGNSDTLVDRIISERPAEWLPKEFRDYTEFLRACEREARETLGKRLGADESQWTWGRNAQVAFAHPLSRAPLIGLQFTIQPFPQNGAGGNVTTVNVGRGVSMRLIADPSDWDQTRQGIALGESGDPASPHWSDQLADWRAVTPRVFPFTAQAVKSAAKQTQVLAPAGK